ncbi:MAG: CSLREA domain-containing protein [Chloroflexi bacterium]|nr:CSLREA domain-containing protein [Chloroflexota bacterium]
MKGIIVYHYHHLTRKCIWIVVCLLLVLVSAPQPQQPLPSAEAAIFTVNSLANADDGTCNVANCTLREAVAAANAAGGADVINFSVSGTITFNTPLIVTDNLTINGSGITLNGNNATPLMNVASATNVTVNRLGFINGFSSLGGAIESNGTLTITNSTFSGNRATSGGAIFNHVGTLTITNSTFSANQATSGNGGAIFNNFPSTVTITSSTFSGNTAAIDGGTMYNDLGSTTTVTSSIIVGGNCTGDPITNGGNNISFNAANCPGTLTNPQLGPLQNNGGFNATILPATDGPAVDAYAAPCATATDQRGISRPLGSGCDIGSTEQVGSTPLAASAVCNGPNLDVTISAGDGPFNITASAGVNTPVNGVNTGTTTINGPEKWDNLTVAETTGDTETINLGQFKCRSNEVPTPLTPAHQSHTTNAFPLFSWTAITNANNYRVFVFDDKVAADRTVDIRQNSGGPTSMQLSTPLPNGRLFWRVRGRQNRLWSLWSVRFTLFKDPVVPFSMNTPVPTIDLNPRSPDGSAPTSAPTIPAPPNSR